ncbi:MAG: hypothetical protein GY941_21515 [Planctomycetes bacterium]|nr:hypothetical protein [Planctomycetota bacterium]
MTIRAMSLQEMLDIYVESDDDRTQRHVLSIFLEVLAERLNVNVTDATMFVWDFEDEEGEADEPVS